MSDSYDSLSSPSYWLHTCNICDNYIDTTNPEVVEIECCDVHFHEECYNDGHIAIHDLDEDEDE